MLALVGGWPIALAVGEANRYPPAMPAHLRRFNEPDHVHFWTISCYRRLGLFHHDGMKRIVIGALKRLQAKFDICLMGYVVIQEHVHVLLFRPRPTVR